MKKIIILALSITLINSCTDDFAEINTNPLDKVSATPEELLPKAIKSGFDASYEYYYDFYRRIMPWTQTIVAETGNANEFMDDGANMNQRKDVFYGTYGSLLTDIIHSIEQMPADQQAKYVNIKSIATILKAQYAWYVSDVNGSIAYKDAFAARYGGTLTPKFDTQEELYDILDKQLSDVYTAISNADQSIQVNPGAKDLFFGGDITKWKKISNSLRLKMATRLLKRNPTKLKTIATEVLSREQISSSADDFSLIAKRFTEHGNFNPNGLSATKPIVDYMVANKDPRLAIFFKKNLYSQNNIDKLVAGGKMSTTTAGQRYVGGPTSPDMVSATKSRYYTSARRQLDGRTYDTISKIQYRLWRPESAEISDDGVAGNVGTGNATFPVLTFADYSLLKAELVVRGIIPGNAQTFYEDGIKASIETYGKMAKEAIVEGYTEPTAQKVSDYINSAQVKYNAGNALEQILTQQYLNYFKQPNEAWALIKRTGFPNNSTTLKLENLTRDGGIAIVMPRRIILNTPSRDNLNYENQKASLDQMKQDPDFGTAENDIHGRIWWDKK